jgi:uncharacterized protein Yka (UPF0111/DUF47 family)
MACESNKEFNQKLTLYVKAFDQTVEAFKNKKDKLFEKFLTYLSSIRDKLETLRNLADTYCKNIDKLTKDISDSTTKETRKDLVKNTLTTFQTLNKELQGLSSMVGSDNDSPDKDSDEDSPDEKSTATAIGEKPTATAIGKIRPALKQESPTRSVVRGKKGSLKGVAPRFLDIFKKREKSAETELSKIQETKEVITHVSLLRSFYEVDSLVDIVSDLELQLTTMLLDITENFQSMYTTKKLLNRYLMNFKANKPEVVEYRKLQKALRNISEEIKTSRSEDELYMNTQVEINNYKIEELLSNVITAFEKTLKIMNTSDMEQLSVLEELFKQTMDTLKVILKDIRELDEGIKQLQKHPEKTELLVNDVLLTFERLKQNINQNFKEQVKAVSNPSTAENDSSSSDEELKFSAPAETTGQGKAKIKLPETNPIGLQSVSLRAEYPLYRNNTKMLTTQILALRHLNAIGGDVSKELYGVHKLLVNVLLRLREVLQKFSAFQKHLKQYRKTIPEERDHDKIVQAINSLPQDA